MSEKYIQASIAGNESGTVTNGCGELASQDAGSAVVFDLWTYLASGGLSGCWRVTGMPIPIGGSYASQQAGFEIFNRNMQARGTQIPIPNNLSLPGPSFGTSTGLV